MMRNLRYASLNVNGLREDGKLQRILHYLRDHRIDVAALQDVRYDPLLHSHWQATTGFRSYWEKRVAIIILNHQVQVDEIESPSDSIISATLTHGSMCLRFTSIYAPAVPDERRAFFRDLSLSFPPHPPLLSRATSTLTLAAPSTGLIRDEAAQTGTISPKTYPASE